MLNGDGNENGIKINTSKQQINKKTNLHVQHSFFLISFYVFLCRRCFARLQCRFVRLKRQLLSYTLFLWRNCRMCLPKILFPVFMFTAPHFHLADRQHFSFSHHRYEIFMFSFQRNSSPLFSITSSLSAIHVSVNIKNNVKKDTTLFFFLSL